MQFSTERPAATWVDGKVLHGTADASSWAKTL